jgi:hypothetical protein
MLWIWYFGGDISPDWVRARLEGWIGRVEANYESRLETLAAARPRDHQPDSLDVAEDEAVAATPRLPRKESARAKAAAELLLDPDHPAEDEVQPREALISVRTQLAQALMGDSSFEPNIPAIAAQLGFDRLDDIEGRPREQSHVELKNTWPHLSVSELRHGLAQASDDDLRTITKQLRFNYDLVQAMRKSPSGTIRAQGLETDVLYDPRDPDYRESSLLTALVIGLKLLQLQDASE